MQHPQQAKDPCPKKPDGRTGGGPGFDAGRHPVTWTLLIALFLLPSAAFSALEVHGVLPGTLADDVMPACVQPLWLVAVLPFVPQWPLIRNREVLRAAALLFALASASVLLRVMADGGASQDAWMPPLAGGVAMLPLAFLERSTGRKLLIAVLVSNAATLLGVLLKRLSEGSDFLRLNVSNLNANSSGLIYGLAFGALVLDKEYRDRRALRWLAALAACVVLVSGSRTALLLLVSPFLSVRALRQLPRLRLVAIAAVLAASTFVFAGRLGEPEEYGTLHPPEDLQGTAFERLNLVGRTWSLILGIDVLTESGTFGTNSVQDAVSAFQDRGYYSFAHSTFLMLLIVHGAVGLVFFLVCLRFLVRRALPLPFKAAVLGVLIISGGIVTNPKEVALTFLVPLLLFPDARAGRPSDLGSRLRAAASVLPGVART